MLEKLNETIRYPRIGTFDAMSSEAIINHINGKSSVLDPLDDSTENQLQDYVKLKLNDFSYGKKIDILSAVANLHRIRSSYEDNCIYYKVTSEYK